MVHPVNNWQDWYIAQSFGNTTSYGKHEGLDINLKTGGDTDLGQELKAIAKGKIVYYHYGSHPSINFGRHLVYQIDGAWGTRWVHYAHCLDQGFLNSVQEVVEGQVIAKLGKSGTPYAHLHMSIFKVDPSTLINKTDSIAHNDSELNSIWEDPLKFMETWISTPTVPEPVITDQTKIPQIENMEVQAIRSLLNDRLSTINILTAKIEKAKADLA